MRDPLAQKRAKHLRRDMTRAETVLWTALKGRALDGWKFRRQHPVGSYVVDFACLEARLIVEVDGATHAQDHEIEHDRKRSAFLTEQRFEVLRVGNLDVYENLDGVARAITASLPPSGPSGHLPRNRGRTSNSETLFPSAACEGAVRVADGGDEPNTCSTVGGSPK